MGILFIDVYSKFLTEAILKAMKRITARKPGRQKELIFNLRFLIALPASRTAPLFCGSKILLLRQPLLNILQTYFELKSARRKSNSLQLSST